MPPHPDFVHKLEPPKRYVPPAPPSSEDEDDSDNDSSDSELENLESQLGDICKYAEYELQNQPLPTQVYLNTQGKTLFNHYALQGTAVALKGGLERYFDLGNRAQVKDSKGVPILYAGPLPIEHEPPPPNPEDSRMVDEESRDLVRHLPFRIERLLSFRPNIVLDPEVMQSYNNIFLLYNAHANVMLQHHFAKWGEEAIFRLGIQSLYQSRLEGLFSSYGSSGPELEPEARFFLTEVFEHQPDINDAEKRLLSRHGGVSVEEIEEFWLKLTMDRKYYLLSRQYMAARELKRTRNLQANALIASQIVGQAQHHPEMHRDRWFKEYANQKWNANSIAHWAALTKWQPGKAFPRAPYSTLRNMPWMTPQIRDIMARRGYPGAEGDRFHIPPELSYLIAMRPEHRLQSGALDEGYNGQSQASGSATSDHPRPFQPTESSTANDGLHNDNGRLSQYGVPVIPDSAGLVGAPIVNTNFPWMKNVQTNGVPTTSLAPNHGPQIQQSLPQQSTQAHYAGQWQSVQPPASLQPQQAFQAVPPPQFVQQSFPNVQQALLYQQQQQQAYLQWQQAHQPVQTLPFQQPPFTTGNQTIPQQSQQLQPPQPVSSTTPGQESDQTDGNI